MPHPRTSRAWWAVCLLFLASGASALAFETLWFHQARLVLGSSFWASSLVPAGFMAGLGLGSALAARRGDALARPLRAYAWVELCVAVSGLLLAILLPRTQAALAPCFRPLLDRPAALAALRFALAFALLLVPATAMGTTLPLLTRALAGAGGTFGRALGQLYGWNTLGAVVGAVWAEGWGVVHLGVLRTPAAPAPPATPYAADREPGGATSSRTASRGMLAAAALSGSAMLALEVLWFRFLSIYVITDSLAFALMLAIVLAGVAAGGFAGARWLRSRVAGWEHVAVLALAAGVLTIACYAASRRVVDLGHFYVIRRALPLLGLGVPLMLPVAALSGLLFTLIGSALRAEDSRDAAAAGALTLSNTLGAALGALAAAFVLVPSLGLERSFFTVAVVYGAVAALALVAGWRQPRRGGRAPLAIAAAVFGASLLAFPFGSMRRDHFSVPIERWSSDPGADVQVREGLTETIFYVESRFAERTRYHRLLTNAFSMSSDDFRDRRYMKLFVYLPVAIHPAPRDALLVCFGVGATAKALTDTAELERIDVVDVSRDILEMSRVAFPLRAEDPLADPRVRVHVEDGRFFLAVTDRRFDLITAEPPPPGIAGVVDLYTREYFRLVHDRLASGGMATYWLPTHSMTESSALAVVRAFCDAFDDCSLWNGFGPDLMLLGTRGAVGPVSQERFAAQWDDPRVAAELHDLGLDRPEQLAALFVADARDLAELTAGTHPVTDDFPGRLGPPPAFFPHDERAPGLYGEWSDAAHAKARFDSSPLVARWLPEGVRRGCGEAFEAQRLLNRLAYAPPRDPTERLQLADAMLTRTSLQAPVAWVLGSDADVQRVLRELPPGSLARPEPSFHVGVQAVAARDLAGALAPLEVAESAPSLREPASLLRLYALRRLGRASEAEALTRELEARWPDREPVRRCLAWLRSLGPSPAQ